MSSEQQVIWRRFELARIYGNYFWEVAVAGNVLQVRFGVVGEFTHVGRRYFATLEALESALNFEIQAKEEEGYREVSDDEVCALYWDGSKDERNGCGIQLWDYIPSMSEQSQESEEPEKRARTKHSARTRHDSHSKEILAPDGFQLIILPEDHPATGHKLDEVVLVPAAPPTPTSPPPAGASARIKDEERLAAKEEARARARHEAAVAEARRLLEESARAQATPIVPPSRTEPIAPRGTAVEVQLDLEQQHTQEEYPVAVGLVPGELPVSMQPEVEALPLVSTPALDPESKPVSLADQLVLLTASVVAAGTALLTSVVWWSASTGPEVETQLQLTWGAAARGFGLAAPALVLGCLLRARPLRTETTRWVERACYVAGLAAFVLGVVGPLYR